MNEKALSNISRANARRFAADPAPTPAPTKDARWLSPEAREKIYKDSVGSAHFDSAAWVLLTMVLESHAYMDERLKQAESDTKRWRQALESLTPGGSEFFNDPVACAKFVLDRTHWRRMKEAEAQIAAKDREIAELRKPCSCCEERGASYRGCGDGCRCDQPYQASPGETSAD